MSVDVNQGGLPGFFADHMGIPNLFIERASGHSFGFLPVGSFVPVVG
jgi:hypothetical protein